MNLHYTRARLLVRMGKLDLAIETPGAQQRRVQDVDAVRGGDHLDIGIRLKAVELIKQLKHGTLHFAIARFLAVEPLGADGVQLVDENDGGCFLLGESEGVAHKLGTVANEHLHELRAGQLQESGLSLSGAGARQKRLAGARRSVEQDALGRMHAQIFEAVLVGHGQHDSLDELFDLLVEAADVAVLFRGTLVHFHGFNARVVLDGQLLKYEIRVLVDADQIARLELFWLYEANHRQKVGLTRRCLDDGALAFALRVQVHVGALFFVALRVNVEYLSFFVLK